MILPDPQIEYSAWDECYSHVENAFKWGHMSQTKEFVDMLSKIKYPVVLDGACGDGGQICAMPNNIFTVGLDQSDKALEVANSKLQHAKKKYYLLTKGHLEKTPFGNEQFDGIILKDVLMQFREPRSVLAEMKRILKPDGLIVITTFSTLDVPQFNRPSKVKWLNESECVYDNVYYTKFYDKCELADLLLSSGLEIQLMYETNENDHPHAGFREEDHEHARLIVYLNKKENHGQL